MGNSNLCIMGILINSSELFGKLGILFDTTKITLGTKQINLSVPNKNIKNFKSQFLNSVFLECNNLIKLFEQHYAWLNFINTQRVSEEKLTDVLRMLLH